MNFIKIVLFILMPISSFCQSFPIDTKVIDDVKKYHGKIATASVQNEWKLEKEDGYNFSNMAKRVVAATTIKENGVSKKIIGLAIYVRGGAGESWNFSRYFVTGSEVVGAAGLTEEKIKAEIIELLTTQPIQVFPDMQDIVWVYDISFPKGLENRTDRTGDVIYTGQITFMRKFVDYEYPFEGGIRKHISPMEIYTRLEDGKMKVKVCSVGYSDASEKVLLSEKEYKKLSVLGTIPFEQLYGESGPNAGKENSKIDDGNNKKNTNNKGSGLPKIKIKGFR